MLPQRALELVILGSCFWLHLPDKNCGTKQNLGWSNKAKKNLYLLTICFIKMLKPLLPLGGSRQAMSLDLPYL